MTGSVRTCKCAGGRRSNWHNWCIVAHPGAQRGHGGRLVISTKYQIICLACGRWWRTKAKYTDYLRVLDLPEAR